MKSTRYDPAATFQPQMGSDVEDLFSELLRVGKWPSVGVITAALVDQADVFAAEHHAALGINSPEIEVFRGVELLLGGAAGRPRGRGWEG